METQFNFIQTALTNKPVDPKGFTGHTNENTKEKKEKKNC